MNKANIVLVGQPNAGKSTVFNVLSDLKTTVSNFSGTSVEIAQSFVNHLGQTFHLVDLPGVYSLNPGDEAEKVTYAYLTQQSIDLIINVVDASMLSRSLELTVELMEFGIPMVIALNMWDEAERKGLKIYPEKLEKLLNIPVVVTSALYGKGIRDLMDTCAKRLHHPEETPIFLEYTSHVEEYVRQLAGYFQNKQVARNGSPRFYTLKSLENPDAVPASIIDNLSPQLQEVRQKIGELHHKDTHETISYERHHLAMKLMEDVSHFVDRKTIPFREKMDRYFLHPILGYFPLLLFFFLFFSVIYLVGNLLSDLVAIPLDKLPGLYEGLKGGHPFWWYTVDGIFQGLSGAVGIVLPFFLPLILLTSWFEDTGYLARIAFLMDGLMHKIGLHGKSVAPFILGLGCTVPAIYGVRIIEHKRERFLTAILLPFVPCTARTSVILALTAAFSGPLGAIFIYAFSMLVVAVAGRLISIFMEKPMGLVLEIPDLKVPSLRISFDKTWQKVKQFLRFALPFLVLGSVLMGWLEYARVNDVINHLFAPMVKTLLGLPEQLGTTLVYGFFRKELVLVMANSAFGVQEISQLPLSSGQVLVFLVFVTLYFPCFSTFVVMWKEFGKRVVLASSFLSISVALGAALLLRLFV